jgi:hypothetical protein
LQVIAGVILTTHTQGPEESVTRWLAIGASLISIGAISLVLRWGTSGRVGTPSFEAMVHILTIATPLASVLLTWHLRRNGHHGGALLSSSPLVLMVIGTSSALVGRAFSLNALLWLDLYVLLAFIVVLGKYGRTILGLPPSTSKVTDGAR